MDLASPGDLQKLREAVRHSQNELEPFRQQYRERLVQYAGDRYGDNRDAVDSPFNILQPRITRMGCSDSCNPCHSWFRLAVSGGGFSFTGCGMLGAGEQHTTGEEHRLAAGTTEPALVLHALPRK